MFLEERKRSHCKNLTMTSGFDLTQWRRRSQQILQKIASPTTRVKADPKKVRHIQTGEFLRKCFQTTLWRSVREKLQPSQHQCDNSVLAPRGRSTCHLPTAHGRQDHWTRRASKWTKETVLDSLDGARCEHAAAVGDTPSLVLCETRISSTDAQRSWRRQLKRGCALRRNKPLGLSPGSARATHCTRGACEMNNAMECSESQTFSLP